MTTQIVRVTRVQVAAARGLLALLGPDETPPPVLLKIANARRRREGEIPTVDQPRA